MGLIATYGPGGSLVTNAPVERLPSLRELEQGSAQYYGGKYLIAESMNLETAKFIAKEIGATFVNSNSFDRV